MAIRLIADDVFIVRVWFDFEPHIEEERNVKRKERMIDLDISCVRTEVETEMRAAACAACRGAPTPV